MITPQVIAEGLKSGAVSLENPHVRTLLEACAAAGIGTTGLNTKSLIKKSSGDGGRKSPSAGGKKSTSPSGPKKAPAAKGSSGTSSTTAVPASGGANGGGGSSSKKKTPPTVTLTSNGVAGGEKKAKGNGNSNGTKPESSKVSPKSPKSPAAGEGANSRGKRTPTKTVGKPGLAVPTTLFPELVRMIDQGGECLLAPGKQLGSCSFGCNRVFPDTSHRVNRPDSLDYSKATYKATSKCVVISLQL